MCGIIATVKIESIYIKNMTRIYKGPIKRIVKRIIVKRIYINKVAILIHQRIFIPNA